MAQFENLAGQRFGMLTVVDRADDYVYDNGRKQVMWRCACDCGKEVVVRAVGLKTKHNVSCGCAKRDRLFKHGLADTRLDIIFRSMKQRCYDVNAANYNAYGGRGIRICQQWLDDKNSFFEWAQKNGYMDGLSIDRIDVDGNYTPDNCRWATPKTQANNRRSSRYLTYGGVTKTVSEWARDIGILPATLHSRLRQGWSTERALEISVSNS